MKRFLVLATITMLGVFLVTPSFGASVAFAEKPESYISLSWKEGEYSNAVTEPFTKPAKIAPGSNDKSTLNIRNDGPGEGLLKVWIVEVKTSPTKEAPFFKEVNAEWASEAGKGSASFYQLAATSETLIGSMKIKKGQVVPLTVGYDYPKESDDMSVPGSKSKGSFKVKVQISGEYVKNAISVKLIPHHVDANKDGKINVGEKIRWEFVIINEGTSTIKGIEVVSKYLSSRGVTAVCDKTVLLAGENTSCWAETMVTDKDAQKGSITMDYSVNGFSPDGSVVETFSGVLNVSVEPVDDDGTKPNKPTKPAKPTKPLNPEKDKTDKQGKPDSKVHPENSKRLTCAAIGKTNIQATDPDYRVYLDRNKNGVACERQLKIPGGVMDAMTNPVMIGGGIAFIVLGTTLAFVAWRKNRAEKTV